MFFIGSSASSVETFSSTHGSHSLFFGLISVPVKWEKIQTNVCLLLKYIHWRASANLVYLNNPESLVFRLKMSPLDKLVTVFWQTAIKKKRSFELILMSFREIGKRFCLFLSNCSWPFSYFCVHHTSWCSLYHHHSDNLRDSPSAPDYFASSLWGH